MAGGPVRGRRAAPVDPVHVALCVQVAEVERDVVGGEHADEVAQLRRAGAAHDVGSDGAGGASAQDVLHERRHVPARPDLDEDARAVVVQRLDRLAEANRLRPVLDEQLADRGRLLGVAPGGGARPQRRAGGAHGQLGEDRAQVLGERGEQRRVHGAVVGELLAHQPLLDRDRFRACGSGGLADEHGLVRAVVHREVELAAGLLADAARARGVGADRQQHRCGNLVALGGGGVGRVQTVREGPEPLVGLDVERAGGHRGGVLAGAVAEHRVAARHEPADHLVDSGVGGQHRLDGDVQLHQPRLGALALGVGERRSREHPVAEQVPARVLGVDAVDAVEHGARLLELQAQVGQHVLVLGALAGEHVDDLAARSQRLGLVVDPRRRLDPPAVGLAQLLDRLAELAHEVLRGGGDERESPRRGRAAEFLAEREREVRERDLGVAFEGAQQLAGRVG